MANDTNAGSERTATPQEQSFNEAPKSFSKATLIVGVIALLFIIIASILFSGFLSDSTGEKGASNTNSTTRSNP